MQNVGSLTSDAVNYLSTSQLLQPATGSTSNVQLSRLDDSVSTSHRYLHHYCTHFHLAPQWPRIR
jgi:hypothetical protein